MRPHFITVIATTFALVAVACAQQTQSDNKSGGSDAAPSVNKTVIYMCGETQVKANFYDGFVDIGLQGKSYNLPRVTAASGEKYERQSGTGRMMFWNKGKSATLTLNGQSYPDCTPVDNAIR